MIDLSGYVALLEFIHADMEMSSLNPSQSLLPCDELVERTPALPLIGKQVGFAHVGGDYLSGTYS